MWRSTLPNRHSQIVRSQVPHRVIPFHSHKVPHLRSPINLSLSRSLRSQRRGHFNTAHGRRRVQPKKNIEQQAITLPLHQVNAVLTLERIQSVGISRCHRARRHSWRQTPHNPRGRCKVDGASFAFFLDFFFGIPIIDFDKAQRPRCRFYTWDF